MESNPAIEEKHNSLQVAIDKINRAYGVGAIWSALETNIPTIQVVSTGAATLDKALGVGGVPRGRITEIYGPEAVGKTTLALSVIANVQAEGGKAAIIDVEHALDLAYAQKIGVNISELLISQPDTGEQALEIAEMLVRGGIECVVLDSVAMLVTEAEIKGEMTDFQVGSQARLMGKALRKLMAPIDKADTVFILINQIRAQIGGYNPETTPGGRAIKYMSSVRIDLRRKEQIKDEDQTIGIRIIAKVVKNKVAPPSKSAELDIIYGRGIDKIGCLIEAAIGCEVMSRSGAWITYREQKSYRTKMKEYLETNPNIRRELEDEVREV